MTLAMMAVPFVLIGGFIIAAICGYMAGLIGASNSPISGVGILSIVSCATVLVLVFHPTAETRIGFYKRNHLLSPDAVIRDQMIADILLEFDLLERVELIFGRMTERHAMSPARHYQQILVDRFEAAHDPIHDGFGHAAIVIIANQHECRLASVGDDDRAVLRCPLGAADILIVAIGRAKFLTADMVRPGAVVIDVGMNRLPAPDKGSGKTRLAGDVAFGEVRRVAGAITPVPGGVGPLTRAMLLYNTVLAAGGPSNPPST
jgi:hypothetical protein